MGEYKGQGRQELWVDSSTCVVPFERGDETREVHNFICFDEPRMLRWDEGGIKRVAIIT